MENPGEDVKKVTQQLLCRPTLMNQAETLRTYFTSGVNFFHLYIDIDGGRDDLTTIYQMAAIIFNHQAAQFHDVVYDGASNAISIHMTVSL
ncbi:hypothetical protein KP509_1Z054900 [Ceratopteris richardii]|nr:hypothetical protein KP509_1Z054900 [Ceratopteris richardii]